MILPGTVLGFYLLNFALFHNLPTLRCFSQFSLKLRETNLQIVLKFVLTLLCLIVWSNKQVVRVPEKYLEMVVEGHNKMTLKKYWDYHKMGVWGGIQKIRGGGGYDNTLILLLELMCSIRKNVRKWIESQMERLLRMFCFLLTCWNLFCLYK